MHSQFLGEAMALSFIINLLIIFSILSIKASAAPNFIYYNCTTDTNFTDNSFYKTNLNNLLSSLSAQSSSNTFYNLTAGSEPSKVYGLYYCRGDLTTQDCNDCVKTAADEIVSGCPSAKEAIVWYEECTFRYSYRPIFSVAEILPGWLSWSLANVTNPSQFLSGLAEIVDQLTQQAVVNTSSKNYAKGSIKVTESQTIYCLVQCTPDLDSSQCQGCLTKARSYISSCCSSGSVYAFINLASCRLMYNIMPFGPGQNRSLSPPPPPPSSLATVPNSASSCCGGKGAKFYVLAIGVPVAGAAFLLLAVILLCLCRHKKVKKITKDDENEDHIEGATKFDLGTMKAATKNFSSANTLGEGGFGIVYKGNFQNGQEVAIKRLSEESKQGVKEFLNEVQLIVKLQHKNLVRLIGFCTEGKQRLLVYEFMPNLSLDRFLFDPSKSEHLPWDVRYKIIEGIARGIHYLHEDSRLTVVHRDLKSSNILLDQHMNPKVADFGIAKHVILDQTQANVNTTKIVGTRGYMAPEYALAGQFSIKSDVYSFGVILLEIIGGKSNSKVDYQGGFLLHAWKRWSEGEIEELIDPTLRDTVSRMELGRSIQIALLCVQYDAASRPTMHTVLLMLNSGSMDLPSPSPPTPFVNADDMNQLREYQNHLTGSEISTTGAWNSETDLYPR